MISLLFILINLIITLIYLKYPKKMHPIQASACYMISVIYTHDFLVIPSVNLGDWEITKKFDYGLIINLNATVAVPVFISLFLERCVAARNFLQEAVTFISWVAFMLLFEYVHHWLRMVYHKNWDINWSIMIWSILGIILILVNKIIKMMIINIGDGEAN